MPSLAAAALLTFLVAVPSQDASAPRPECREWHECRQLANDAAARQDFESFHDLAWRAVQLGPKNDPDLMYLLARAQSLSGRPGDALVMLQRLADFRVPVDAVTSDDFRRVRALRGWPELEAKIGGRAGAPSVKEEPSPASDLRPTAGVPRSTPIPASPAAPSPSVPEASAAGVEALRFKTVPFTPAGLAYDAVSRRFIVGDRHARKLAVVDEFSQHVANLASAQTNGFGEIAALEIDPREGNLWVVSADSPRTVLHKLQLVSGRSLGSYSAPRDAGDVRFLDVAAAGENVVLVLDAAGHRLFRLRSKSDSLELAAALPDGAPLSLAPAPEGVVYVADDRGMARVDLASRRTERVSAAPRIELTGLSRIRWFKGSLVGVQQSAGAYRAVRIRLDRGGRKATAIEVLDASLSTTDPTAATVSGNVLYYLASGEGAEMIVKKVSLK